MQLTSDQTQAIQARVSYGKEAYARVLAEVAEASQAKDWAGEGKIEDRFPHVKPAHVAHVLRGLLKADDAPALIVAKSEEYGICLLPA